MPNGGVPRNLVVLLKRSGHVVHCEEAEIRIHTREAWAREGAAAPPLLSLSSSEAGVIAWHLAYWHEYRGEALRATDPEVDMRRDY